MYVVSGQKLFEERGWPRYITYKIVVQEIIILPIYLLSIIKIIALK